MAQRGRRLEGWPNTTARLEQSDTAGYDFVRAGWSMPPALTDHTACPGLGLLSCKRLAIQAAVAAGLLINVHKIPASWKSHMARRVISLGWPTHLRQPADQEY